MEPKDQIKERIDIVELIGSYLELKPAGSGSFKALCPFHGEKTPSFYVSRDKEIWHCFGCDKGGDVFSFVMDLEGMSFPEALRLLGQKTGVEIPEYKPTKESNEETFLKDLNEMSAKVYETVLWQHDDGKAAREYLATRGIDEELAKKFRLGFAPDRWEALVTMLRKRGYSDDRIVKAGLGKKKKAGTGLIDQFRNRLTIPLCDRHGNVLGFTGRQLDTDTPGPKYLNTPETAIYHKSQVLFGLYLAKTAIRTAKSVIIVEGNLDVVASHKAGVEHVVASSGTALTQEQLKQLKKLTNKLLFCFDADAAGFAAAQRGIRLAQSMGFDITVIEIPESLGKDPDDVVQKDPEAWGKLVAKPVHMMEYYLNKGLERHDVKTSEGKRDFAHFLVKEVAELRDPIERDHWAQRIADVAQVGRDVLQKLIQPQVGNRPNPAFKKPASETAAQKPSQLHQAAEFLVGALLHKPEMVDDIVSRLDANHLPEEPWGDIYKKLVMIYTDASSSVSAQKSLFSLAQAHFQSAEDTTRLLRRSVIRAQEQLADLTRDQVREELNRHISLLADRQAKQEREQLLMHIREAERAQDADRLSVLLEKYNTLLKADSSR